MRDFKVGDKFRVKWNTGSRLARIERVRKDGFGHDVWIRTYNAKSDTWNKTLSCYAAHVLDTEIVESD